jgi:hypothetical protein
MATLLDQIERKPRASEEAIKAMVARIGVEPPGDYLDFLWLTNGGTGSGPDIFVILFAAEEVGTPELDYGAPEYAPGLMVIGGDGCGNIIGIDTRNTDPSLHEYVVLDPVWMDLDSESVQYRGKTFGDMFRHLVRRFGDT